MKRSYRSVARGLLLATALAGGALPAIADATSADVEGKGGSANVLFEEILVYATKRSTAQKAQDVPMQISAFGDNQLAARQVVTIEDLSFATPNVSLDGVGTSPGVQNFAIRGLGINSSIPSVDPTVGVFNDGVYLGVTFGVVVDTFDLESVEILKGPQGLLFGRNVTGGAVLLRSRRPDGEFRIRGKLGLETGLQTTAGLAVEGSLVPDKVAAKLSVYYKDDKGSIDNATLGRDIGKEETYILRPTLVFTPSDTFDTTIILERGDTEGDGSTAQAADGHTPSEPNDEIRSVINEAGYVDIKWTQLTVESNLDIWNGRITNIFGYRDLVSDTMGDIDGTPLTLFHADFATNQSQWSDELRYSGLVMPGWTLTTGGYYFSQDIMYRERRNLPPLNALLAGGGDQDHKVWGVFVNNDIDLSTGLTLTAGVRYTRESKDAQVYRLGICTYDTRECPTDFTGNGSWSDVTPKIGLQWRANDDVMLYAHWTRGFRSGGFNFRANPSIFSPGPTDAEGQNAYELGLKSSFADNRIRLNAALFQNDISDMQRELNTSDPEQGVVQGIVNTADARIRGIEIDTLVRVTDRFALNAALGYLDGDYKNILFDISGDGMIDDTDYGLRIPRLADWTVNLGASYDLPIGDLGTLTARADFSYRSKTVFTDNNLGALPAYEIVNAGLAFTSANGTWTLSLYGKNLTDEAVLGGMTVLPFGALAPYYGTVKEGRRYGVELRFDF